MTMDTPIEGEKNAPFIPDAPAAGQVTKTEAPAEPAAPVAAEPPKGKTKVRRQSQVKTMNVVTAEEVTKTEVTEEEADDLPKSVKLAAPYAFYEDDGALRSWAAGQTVEDPAEITVLVERGALFEAE
jgi:hypothetical protein